MLTCPSSLPPSRRWWCALVLPLAALLLIACHGRRTYHHFEPVDPTGWTVADTVRFRPETIDEDRLYTLSVGVRFADSYAYRDLWIVVEQRAGRRQPAPLTPYGDKPRRTALTPVRRDTLHMILADSKGKWLAQGVAMHEAEEVITAARLSKDYDTEFLLYHIMRQQTVQGICEVGLKIK